MKRWDLKLGFNFLLILCYTFKDMKCLGKLCQEANKLDHSDALQACVNFVTCNTYIAEAIGRNEWFLNYVCFLQRTPKTMKQKGMKLKLLSK